MNQNKKNEDYKFIINKIKKSLNILIEFYLTKLPLIYLFIAFIIKYSFNKSSIIFIKYNESELFIDTVLFSSNRLEMLITISVVLIGFYVTIISVFGSGYSQAIVKLANNKLSEKFMSYTKHSIISTFTLFILTIFYDAIKFEFFVMVYMSIFLYVIACFIRFTAIILKMYNENISTASDVAKEKFESNKEILKVLLKIKNEIEVNKISSDLNYYNRIKDNADKERAAAKDLPYKEESETE